MPNPRGRSPKPWVVSPQIRGALPVQFLWPASQATDATLNAAVGDLRIERPTALRAPQLRKSCEPAKEGSNGKNFRKTFSDGELAQTAAVAQVHRFDRASPLKFLPMLPVRSGSLYSRQVRLPRSEGDVAPSLPHVGEPGSGATL
jgi:hypothetical protein